MPDLSGLYPQPPNQQQGSALSGDPLKLLGALGQLQDFQIRQQQAPALMQQPAVALQGGQIANTSAQMLQQAEARKVIAGEFGTALAGMANPTPDDVHSLTAYIARSHPEIAAKYPDIINAAADIALKHPKGVKYGGGLLLNMGMSPEAVSGRVTGPPGPGGVPQTLSTGQANMAGPGGLPIGQAPGEPETQAAAAERSSKLQSTAATTAQYHADLDNLKRESKVLEIGGPTVEFEKKANQFLGRIGAPGLGTMTPEQLKAAEGFDKIANQISLNQSQFFHGSDAGLHTVVGANPSSSMSRYGREGVIDMLQGNQDAIDVTRKMWRAERDKGAPANSYDSFVDKLSDSLDPRVFQFNRMSRDNQQKFLSQLDPEDLGDFEKKYQYAIGQKWVKPLKKSPNANQ